MATIYFCDHCNHEPLFLRNGRCPSCGNEVVKVVERKGESKRETGERLNAKA